MLLLAIIFAYKSASSGTQKVLLLSEFTLKIRLKISRENVKKNERNFEQGKGTGRGRNDIGKGEI